MFLFDTLNTHLVIDQLASVFDQEATGFHRFFEFEPPALHLGLKRDHVLALVAPVGEHAVGALT